MGNVLPSNVVTPQDLKSLLPRGDGAYLYNVDDDSTTMVKILPGKYDSLHGFKVESENRDLGSVKGKMLIPDVTYSNLLLSPGCELKWSNGVIATDKSEKLYRSEGPRGPSRTGQGLNIKSLTLTCRSQPQCSADHGSDAPCCGQPETSTDRKGHVRACPSSAPTCVGYHANVKMGVCTAGTLTLMSPIDFEGVPSSPYSSEPAPFPPPSSPGSPRPSQKFGNFQPMPYVFTPSESALSQTPPPSLQTSSDEMMYNIILILFMVAIVGVVIVRLKSRKEKV